MPPYPPHPPSPTPRRPPPWLRRTPPQNWGTVIPPQVPGGMPLGRVPDHPWWTVFRVQSITYDYLLCEGWDPWLHAYLSDIPVAKPYLLRENDCPTRIRFPSDGEVSTRTGDQEKYADYYDLADTPGVNYPTNQQCRVVDPPYFVGDLIVAHRLVGPWGDSVVKPVYDANGLQLTPAEQGFPTADSVEMLQDQSGRPIFWQDANVAGRKWIPAWAYRYFEVKYAHTPGATTEVHPLIWSGTDWVVDTQASHEFGVKDYWGIFRGRAKDAYASPHNQGSRGYAVYSGTKPCGWHMRWLQPHALMVKGQLTDDLASTDSTFEIDGFEIMQPTGGLIVDQDPGDDLTIQNTFSCEGDDNGIVIAEWNEAQAHWEAQGIACPA